MRLNDAGVRRFFSGVKEFQKFSGVSSNFSGVSNKKWGIRVSGVVLQGGVSLTKIETSYIVAFLTVLTADL